MLMRTCKAGLQLIAALVHKATAGMSVASRLAVRQLFLDRLDLEMQLDIGGGKTLHLCVLDAGSVSRNARILTKEPMTITWLDSMGPDDVLWDVGANIGSYSLYAAMRRGVTAVAFEPMAENYIALSRNVMRNGLSGLVLPCGVALDETPGWGQLHLSGITSGAAGHTFSQAANDHGGALCQPVLGIDAATLIGMGLPQPTHLKVDVDGIELRILKGSDCMLSDPKLRSILIEVTQNDTGIRDILTRKGFVEKSAEGDNWIFVRSGTGAD